VTSIWTLTDTVGMYLCQVDLAAQILLSHDMHPSAEAQILSFDNQGVNANVNVNVKKSEAAHVHCDEGGVSESERELGARIAQL
jgi:hypothetical protein